LAQKQKKRDRKTHGALASAVSLCAPATDGFVHEQSAGRSSTRLHAPPGGHSSMGTSFSWGADEAPVPSRRGGRGLATVTATGQQPPADFGQVGSGGWSYAGREQPHPGHMQDAPSHFSSSAHMSAEAGLKPAYQASGEDALGSRGFGDTGSSCVRLHAPAGGGNSMGNSFGWTDDNAAPPLTPTRPKDAYAEHMRSQNGSGTPQSASSQNFGVGSQVRTHVT
jgi:hypothetical protein